MIKKALALLMISLIIALPLVSADMISVEHAYGADMVPGYAKGTDNIEVQVKVQRDDPLVPVENTQVRITNPIGGGYDSFTACAPPADALDGQYYLCTYTHPWEKLAGSYYYDVSLLGSDNAAIASSGFTLIVDNIPPEITIANFARINEEGFNAALTFTAKDRAYSGDDYSNCIGIQRIEIFDGEVLLETISEIPAENRCFYTATKKLNIPVTGTVNKSLYVKAYDAFGKESVMQQTDEISFDLTQPEIGNMALYLTEEKPLEQPYFIGPERITLAKAMVNVSDDVELVSVTGDFNAFNDEREAYVLSFVKLRPDSAVDKTYVAENIDVKLSAAGSYDVVVKATDHDGNVIEKTFTFQFNYDAEGSKVTGIETDHRIESIYYVNGNPKDNVFTVTLDDGAGIGFGNNHDAWFSMEGITGTDTRADYCMQEGSVWKCTLENVTVTSLVHKDTTALFMEGRSKDDLGNFVTDNTFALNVTADLEGPQVTFFGKKAYAAENPLFLDELMTGHAAEFTVNVTDDGVGGVLGTINLSRINRDMHDLVDLDCQELDDGNDALHSYTCTYMLDEIKTRGNRGLNDVRLPLLFTDAIGNIRNYTAAPFSVIGTNDTEPDYYTVLRGPGAPRTIDRQIMEFRDTSIMFPFRLSPNTDVEDTADFMPVPDSLEILDCHGYPCLNMVNGTCLEWDNTALLLMNPQKPELFQFINPAALASLTGVYAPSVNKVATGQEQNDSQFLIFGLESQGSANDSSNSYGTFRPQFFYDEDLFKNKNDNYFFLRYTFDTVKAPRVEYLDVTCQISVRSLVKDKDGLFVISEPEYENVSVSIGFSNSPLGELSEKVKDKIKKGKKMFGIGGPLDPIMDALNNLLSISRAICQFVNTFTKLQTVFASITSGTAWCAALSPACASINEVSSKEVDLGENVIHGPQPVRSDKGLAGTALKFCSMVSCTLPDANEPMKEYEKTIEKLTKKGDEAALAAYKTEHTDPESGMVKVDQKDDEKLRGVDRTQSLVLSVMPPNPCIPGIIDGINRYRQIGCEYVLCLQRTAYGMPVDACESQKGYNLCRYVVGEALYVVPMASMYSEMAQTLKQALSSPAAMFGMALKWGCDAHCSSGTGGSLCYVCVAADTANFIAETACDLGVGPDGSCTPIWEKIGGNKYGDICSQIKDDEEKKEKGDAALADTQSDDAPSDEGGDGQ